MELTLASNFYERFATGLILGIVILSLIALGFPFIQLGLLVLAWFSVQEWLSFLKTKNLQVNSFFSLIGFIYLTGALLGLLGLSFYEKAHICLLFLVVWTTDVGAYLFGKYFGGPKVFPLVSPNKTWSGCVGGLLTCIFTLILLHHFHLLRITHLTHKIFWVALVLSISAQLGDFLESAVKRYVGVKDSGTLLKGHGGFLDRFDSLFAATIVYVLVFL